MESKIKFYGGKTYPKDMGKNEVERSILLAFYFFLHLLDNTCKKWKKSCFMIVLVGDKVKIKESTPIGRRFLCRIST